MTAPKKTTKKKPSVRTLIASDAKQYRDIQELADEVLQLLVERNRALLALVKLADGLGYDTGIAPNPDRGATERNLVVVEFNSGQVAWPITDNDMAWFVMMGVSEFQGKLELGGDSLQRWRCEKPFGDRTGKT